LSPSLLMTSRCVPSRTTPSRPVAVTLAVRRATPTLPGSGPLGWQPGHAGRGGRRGRWLSAGVRSV